MASKKLLVADDSLTIQKVIRLALSNEGYDIQAVADGNDAVQQISLFRPDVVLIDVSLPGKTAFEVKRAINQHDDLEDVRFVLMSSAFEKVDEVQSREVQFHGTLTKPFDPAHLREVLSQVLAQISSRKMEPTSLLTRPGLNPETSTPQISTLPPLPAGPAVEDEFPEVSLGAEFKSPFSFEEPPAPIPPALPDTDIRQLTESTIRLSGLDDFNWNIQEPSLRPPSTTQDTGGTTFQLDLPESPLPPDILAANAYHDAPDESPDELPHHDAFAPPPLPETPQSAGAGLTAAPSLNDAEIEEMIRKKVEESLEKLAKTILPQVAERVIKAEIHRLLNEQP